MWTWVDESLFIGLREPFNVLKVPYIGLRASCVGLKDLWVLLSGRSYGLLSKWTPSRPKRAIYRCWMACAAMRGPSYSLPRAHIRGHTDSCPPYELGGGGALRREPFQVAECRLNMVLNTSAEGRL